MKPLKLHWKRGNPQEAANLAIYGQLKAVYKAKGKVKIGGVAVSYLAGAVNPVDRAKGTDPWQVTVQVADQRVQHRGKTFSAVKELAFKEIRGRIDSMEKEAAERADLMARILTIYEGQGQKIMGKGFEGHAISGLKKHLAALQAGKFPWKMPPSKVPETPAIDRAPSALPAIVRKPVPESTRDLVFREVKACLERRIQEKGDGAFVSVHELRGVLDEEWDELAEAMHSKKLGPIEAELKDLIVGAVFGLACIRAGAFNCVE
jgi:hypothetical protein